jgi:hypothetical protein
MRDERKEGYEILASPAASKLGEVHWHILRASTLMHSLTLRQKAGETGRFVQYEQTEFGREVGRDEINWTRPKRRLLYNKMEEHKIEESRETLSDKDSSRG